MNSSMASTILSSGMLWTAVWRRGQPSGIGEVLLSWRYFIQLSELLIEVEDKLLSGTPPRFFIQDSCSDICV